MIYRESSKIDINAWNEVENEIMKKSIFLDDPRRTKYNYITYTLKEIIDNIKFYNDSLESIDNTYDVSYGSIAIDLLIKNIANRILSLLHNDDIFNPRIRDSILNSLKRSKFFRGCGVFSMELTKTDHVNKNGRVYTAEALNNALRSSNLPEMGIITSTSIRKAEDLRYRGQRPHNEKLKDELDRFLDNNKNRIDTVKPISFVDEVSMFIRKDPSIMEPAKPKDPEDLLNVDLEEYLNKKR